jgi:hypothetical protein
MKACREGRGTAPLIRKLFTGWRLSGQMHSSAELLKEGAVHYYPVNRGLGGRQRRSGEKGKVWPSVSN